MKMMRRSTQMMKMSTGSLLLLLALCVIRSQAISTVEVNTGPSQAEPQIAMFCGRQLLHMNVESGQWEPDPQGRQGCFTEPTQIISYCQEMYPALQISHVEESSSPVTIPAWCATGFSHCQTRPFIVIPYRCLGEYVSEALLVPDRCRFLHQEQMDTCETYVYWHGVARQACSAESLELHSYGMLLPCGERFRGVEYVCCPGRAGSSSGRFEGDETLQSVTVTPPPGGVTAGSSVKATPATAKPTTSAESQQEEEGDEEEEEEEVGELEEGGAKDGEYEYSIDSGPYQATDYLDSVYYEKSSRSRTSAVPHTRGDSFPTPRPTDGVDVYFEMPGEDSEHASFLRARMDLEERRMKSINEIMKEWAEADNQSRNLPKSDRQALNEHFQSVLQTLEEQVAGERQRLVETHLARVVASLNNNRRLALESYLSAVQSDPPQAERVLQALKRYMSAEQKDRRHTLRHYHHIETVDPQKAEQMKFQVYTHLHVIEERMNQSLALLYKMPLLAEELHDEIQELVKEERSDLSQLMTTSFSETRTTEELLPAESEEEKDDEEEEERAFQSRPYPPRIDSQTSSRKGSTMDEYDYNAAEKVPTYEYEEKMNTSMELKRLIYKSPGIQRDELQPDALDTFNRGAMVGLLVVAVAIAMVMVISLLLVRRKPYGTISHGIVEQVDPMLSPEERKLTKMQNHGYENPTYKFFEQMN